MIQSCPVPSCPRCDFQYVVPWVKPLPCSTVSDIPHYQVQDAYKNCTLQGLQPHAIDEMHVQQRVPEVLEGCDIKKEIEAYTAYEFTIGPIDLLLSAADEMVASHFMASELLMRHRKKQSLQTKRHRLDLLQSPDLLPGLLRQHQQHARHEEERQAAFDEACVLADFHMPLLSRVVQSAIFYIPCVSGLQEFWIVARFKLLQPQAVKLGRAERKGRKDVDGLAV